MITNNQFLNWLKENFQRFASAHPVFYKWWIRIFTALIALNGIPELLNFITVPIPEWIIDITKKWVAYLSIGGWWMAWIATSSPVVGVAEDGTLLKKTDEKKLPFTAQAEEKAATNKEGGILNPETAKKTELAELIVQK